jgi:hypothetical protein
LNLKAVEVTELEVLNHWLDRLGRISEVLGDGGGIVSVFDPKTVRYRKVVEIRRRVESYIERWLPRFEVDEGSEVEDFIRERVLETFSGECLAFLRNKDFVWTRGSPFGIDIKLIEGGVDTGFSLFDVWLEYCLKDYCRASERDISELVAVTFPIKKAVHLLRNLVAPHNDVLKRCFLSSFGEVCSKLIEDALEGRGVKDVECVDVTEFLKDVILEWIKWYISECILERIGVVKGKKFEMVDVSVIDKLVDLFPYLSEFLIRFKEMARVGSLRSFRIVSVNYDGKVVMKAIVLAGGEEKSYGDFFGFLTPVIESVQEDEWWSGCSYVAAYYEQLIDQIVKNSYDEGRLIQFFDVLKVHIDERIENLKRILCSGFEVVK